MTTTVPVATKPQTPLEPTRKRDWGMTLTLGFIEDRNGKRRTINWPIFLSLGVLLPTGALIGLYRAFTTGTSVGLWVLAVSLWFITNLSVNTYYHRGLTHEGMKLHVAVQHILAVGSGLAWMGSALRWVRDHRVHHTFADVVGKDPHSPWEYDGWRGLLWAQGVWLFFKVDRPDKSEYPDYLLKNKVVMWHHKWWGYPVQTVASVAIPAMLYGWNGLFIAGFLRIAFLQTMTGMVNSYCHMYGSRSTDSLGQEYLCDDSRNSIPVALLSAGEGNHSEHHADPRCARHGRRVVLTPEAIAAGVKPDRRFKPDPTWRFIQLLSVLGLATDVREPKEYMHFKNSQIAPKQSLRGLHANDRSRAARRAHRRDLRRAAAQEPAGKV